MAEVTVSIPDNLLPIIDNLEVPLSTWIVEQLRLYAQTLSEVGLLRDLLADAALEQDSPPTQTEWLVVLDRMERSAAW